ncbi:MAG: sirohydrochlorin cobaltochelatase [Desulfovibrionaceae bacterium]|nr:sirohydrochlorin cobaltochelatase [Desulfovibrionaceae bacterium]
MKIINQLMQTPRKTLPKTGSGILLITFGSSSLQGKTALEHFEKNVRHLLPHRAVRWACTSGHLREVLATQHIKTDSVSKALLKMHFERFHDVIVQPLQVISGREFEAVASIVAESQHLFQRLVLSQPLLTETTVQAAAEALAGLIPQNAGPHTAVLFAGHGSPHAAERLYALLERALQKQTSLPCRIGTLSGRIRLEQILPYFSALGIRTVLLYPLLSLIGRHALSDLAGADENSWKSRIEQNGMICCPVLRGMVETKSLAQIWLNHLLQAVSDRETSSFLSENIP